MHGLATSAALHSIGPGIAEIEATWKHTAREIASRCRSPLLQGTGLLSDFRRSVTRCRRPDLSSYAQKLRGGRRDRDAHVPVTAGELEEAFESVVRLSTNSFGDGRVYLEKFVERAKHVEVQIFGDGRDTLVLGARDCSAQRRHQKVIEETPVPGLAADVQEQLFRSARLLGNAVKYRSAGTVEFLFDTDSNEYYFLEVNTRLQVEHGVTEQVTGVDLVEMMIQEAAKELPSPELLHVNHRVARLKREFMLRILRRVFCRRLGYSRTSCFLSQRWRA